MLAINGAGWKGTNINLIITTNISINVNLQQTVRIRKTQYVSKDQKRPKRKA